MYRKKRSLRELQKASKAYFIEKKRYKSAAKSRETVDYAALLRLVITALLV